MFTFGLASTRRLEICHPDLRLLAGEALATSVVDFTVTDGQRGEVEQNEAFATNKSKARFGESAHNCQPFSLAMDIAPYINGALCYDEDLMEALADHIQDVADELFEDGRIDRRIEWGGKWRDEGGKRWDLPHWQVKGWRDKT